MDTKKVVDNLLKEDYAGDSPASEFENAIDYVVDELVNNMLHRLISESKRIAEEHNLQNIDDIETVFIEKLIKRINKLEV